jgi:hypothetical protein
MSKLFATRHWNSMSVSGAKVLAASHEGDKQFYHAMTASPKGETNGHVKKAIMTY